MGEEGTYANRHNRFKNLATNAKVLGNWERLMSKWPAYATKQMAWPQTALQNVGHSRQMEDDAK